MTDVIAKESDLVDAIRSFLELGSLRNQLVHRDFANFPLDKTGQEIFELYKRAVRFVECLPDHLRTFASKG